MISARKYTSLNMVSEEFPCKETKPAPTVVPPAAVVPPAVLPVVENVDVDVTEKVNVSNSPIRTKLNKVLTSLNNMVKVLSKSHEN